MVEKVKGLAFRLLEDAVGRSDRVSLVAFRAGVPRGHGRAAADGEPAAAPRSA